MISKRNFRSKNPHDVFKRTNVGRGRRETVAQSLRFRGARTGRGRLCRRRGEPQCYRDNAWQQRRRRRCASRRAARNGITYSSARRCGPVTLRTAGDMDQLSIVRLAGNTVLPLAYVIIAALLVVAGYFLALKTQVSETRAPSSDARPIGEWGGGERLSARIGSRGSVITSPGPERVV